MSLGGLQVVVPPHLILVSLLPPTYHSLSHLLIIYSYVLDSANVRRMVVRTAVWFGIIFDFE